MVLRIFGLKEEATYGTMPVGTFTPDHHRHVNKGDFKLNDDPIVFGDGSRMNQTARPGACKPSGSIESKVDLKRIGHSMKAFLDQYEFTAGTGTAKNTHEFYGSESQSLTSFTGVETYDLFEKIMSGMILDGLKLECSDEAMTIAEDWLYKTQKINSITESTYSVIDVAGAIPIMFYDISVQIDNSPAPGVNSSFTLEGKNNCNQDSCIGFGSRFPQIKPQAQKRELTANLVTTLRNETLTLIKKAEHGADSATPSACQLVKINLKIRIQTCEDATEYMEILFPQSLFTVEYEASDSDEIETTFNLQALGSGTVTLADNTQVVTDMYVKLVNNQPEISSTTPVVNNNNENDDD